MKRVLLITILIAIGVVFSTVYRFPGTKRTGLPMPSPTPTPPLLSGGRTVRTAAGLIYAYAVYVLPTLSEVRLIGNFHEGMTSRDVYQDNGCSTLTSGGFYTTDERPIGMFRTGGSTLSEPLDDAFYNGYIVIGTNPGFRITDTPPDAETDVLQSGPILIDGEEPRILRLSIDEEARRIAAFVTEDGQSGFLAVHAPDNTFAGPMLVDLPEIVRIVSVQESLGIATALNLDGGAHSAFISPETQLSELSPVGSFLCIKQIE